MYKPNYQNMMNSYHDGFHHNCHNNQFIPNSSSNYPMQREPFNRYRQPMKQNYNEEHWCETCDRGFFSLELLEKHKQEHQKCNIDGCQFIAHPKVITRHIQMQHSSGLYNKIAKLNNPEEIQKWREERKRRYPTKENIDKKTAEIKEKIDRGEKIGLNQDRSKKHFNKGPHNKNYNPRNENNHPYRSRQSFNNGNRTSLTKIKKPVFPKKVHDVLPSNENLRKLKPFAGIQDIVMESSTTEDVLDDTSCNFEIEDDECPNSSKPIPEETHTLSETEPKVCGALSLLMCDYEFSDDEDNAKDDITIELSNPGEVKGKPLTNGQISEIPKAKDIIVADTKKIDAEKSDDEGPEEIKIDKNIETQTFQNQLKTEEPNKKRKGFIEKNLNRNKFNRPKHRIPSTLLQKLLRKEVQQERNIVLQCVRHIVKNNYFDKIK